MVHINIHEAKTHLSKYLPRLEAGETIVLCKRNVPIAEIRPLPKHNAAARVLGLDRDKVQILPSFFEPLPEDLLTEFGE
jgi:antitoxin (DNA-binding transcriptional repressor) of toxin-antitoxin stability system